MALSIARGPIALGELYFTLNAAKISNFFFMASGISKLVFFFPVYGRGTFEKLVPFCTYLAGKMAAKRAITWRFSTTTLVFSFPIFCPPFLPFLPPRPLLYTGCAAANMQLQHVNMANERNKTTLRC